MPSDAVPGIAAVVFAAIFAVAFVDRASVLVELQVGDISRHTAYSHLSVHGTVGGPLLSAETAETEMRRFMYGLQHGLESVTINAGSGKKLCGGC